MNSMEIWNSQFLPLPAERRAPSAANPNLAPAELQRKIADGWMDACQKARTKIAIRFKEMFSRLCWPAAALCPSAQKHGGRHTSVGRS
jgi:hypothetical protein